ncbi:MAG TPA: hypothetical protein HA272_09135 [Methanoregula sp.]|nr:hypothetical protein [Methanoregula sp.]
MPIEEVVNRIVKLNDGLRYFWTNAGGWAPIEAAQLLSKSRLDWQVSLSRSLKIWLEVPSADENDGRLILAWANLGSLAEGTMKLFLSVHFVDYQNDIEPIKEKNGNLIDPDVLHLGRMRHFFKKRIWSNRDFDWDAWIQKIQQRRNAIHAYKDKDIGTFDEFFVDVRQYLIFLQEMNSGLPYPDSGYRPREELKIRTKCAYISRTHPDF